MDNWKRDRIIEIIYLMERKEIDQNWVRNKLSEYGVPQKSMHESNIHDLLEICPVDVISRLNSEMRKMEIKNWVALIPLFCNADLEKKFLKSLSKKQSRIFIYLAERGEKTAPQIAKELKLPINDTRHILEVLQKKGTVTTSFKPPSRFKVVSRQEALERLSKESKK